MESPSADRTAAWWCNRLDAFRRARFGEPTRHPAVGATLRFDPPVTGPIVLGRLAHFGLGRFERVPNFEELA